jgi:uncharacterized protein (DUF697 family)
MTSREIARDVLLEALGSSATPFVPVPFVDDWLVARILRRITKKVLARHGIDPTSELQRSIVDGFVDAGGEPLAHKVGVGAVRFVVRKVAVVLDVKKSHDVFGQAIAFALALDAAIARGALQSRPAMEIGNILHRALESVGSAAIEGLASAVRKAFAKTAEGGSQQTRVVRVSDAVGAHIEDAHVRLAHAVDNELSAHRR